MFWNTLSSLLLSKKLVSIFTLFKKRKSYSLSACKTLLVMSYSVIYNSYNSQLTSAVWLCPSWGGSETASGVDTWAGWACELSIWWKEMEENGRVRLNTTWNCKFLLQKIRIIIYSLIFYLCTKNIVLHILYFGYRRGGAIFKVVFFFLWLISFDETRQRAQLTKIIFPWFLFLFPPCRFLSPLYHQLEPEWCHSPMVFPRFV